MCETARLESQFDARARIPKIPLQRKLACYERDAAADAAAVATSRGYVRRAL